MNKLQLIDADTLYYKPLAHPKMLIEEYHSQKGKEMRHEYVGIPPNLGNRRSGERGSASGADAGVSEADNAPRYRPLRACHEGL